MSQQKSRKHFSEKKREAQEQHKKAAAKKRSQKKKMKKVNKEEKFSDILMEHGAKYRAFKAAKKYAKLGEKIQMEGDALRKDGWPRRRREAAPQGGAHAGGPGCEEGQEGREGWEEEALP